MASMAYYEGFVILMLVLSPAISGKMDATGTIPFSKFSYSALAYYFRWEHRCPAKTSESSLKQSSTHHVTQSLASRAPWKCYGTCTKSRKPKNFCITDCCTKTTELPIVFTHSFCALAGITLEDDNGGTIGCNLLQNSEGTTWTVAVEQGTSCRAICYNINEPQRLHFAHHVFRTSYRAYVQSADHVFLCFLNGVRFDGKGSGLCGDTGCSGYCQLEYTIDKVWVISAEGTSQPTCNVSCIHADCGHFNRNGLSVFQPGTECRDWGTYPECFISEIGMAIPVSPPSHDQCVKPSCQMTIDSSGEFNISVTGQQTRCAATCTCTYADPYKVLGCVPF